MSTTETKTADSGKLIVKDNSAISYLMDTSRFEHCYRIARLMASASLIPDHLKVDPRSKQMLAPETIAANCFMIVNQAFRWEFDPFGVAPETYVIGGKLAFQGKLVAAAINARAGLEDRLNYTFDGKPGTDDFAVTVSGRIKGEKEPRTVRVSVGQAKTGNDMWRKDPEQKLIYTGAIKWARRHTPEIILGVLIVDEIEDTEIRQTTGRVVGNGETSGKQIQETNPFDNPAFQQAETTPTEPAAKSEPVPAEVVETTAAEATADPERPDKQTMVADIREACVERNVSTPEATRRYRAYGVIPIGKKFQDLSDDELFEVWKVRGIALDAQPEAAAVEGGDK